MALSKDDIRNIKVAAKMKELKASQSVGTDNKGGYTVEQLLLNELINSHPMSGAHQKARRVEMKSSSMSVASVLSSVSIEGVSEGATINANDITFSSHVLDTKKLGARIVVSNELAEDWKAGDLPSELLRDVSAQLSLAVDGSLFGTNSLMGGDILGDAGVTEVTPVDLASMTLADLNAAKVAAGRVDGEMPEWYLSPTVWDGQVSDLLSAAGIPISYDSQDRPRLLDLPVNLSSGLSGGSTSGDIVAVCGSMRASVVYGHHSMVVNKFTEVLAKNDQCVFQFLLRGDLKVVQPQHLSKVVLA